jgi:hypothetical protein
MEGDHDLRKFITESAIAPRRGVFSSGRAARGAEGLVRLTVQGGGALPAGRMTVGGGVEPDISNVGRLTLGAGIESSRAMGSDLWAAEALQEAETEVGVAVMIDRAPATALRAAGWMPLSADPSTEVGLTA